MAEYAVAFVVERLTNLLVQEAAYLDGVSDKVQKLRNELKWMQCFLKDADVNQEVNERMRNWVSDIRDVAFDAEQVIDAYISKAASQRKRHIITKPIQHYKLGRKIESIRSRIREITSQRDTYGVVSTSKDAGNSSSTTEKLKWWRQPPPHIEGVDVIELVEDTRILLAQLTRMEQRCELISIVGMGGLGKTTLAKRLYGHSDTQNHFDYKAWVYVSKDYRRREILQGIIMDANALNKYEMQNLEKLTEEELLKRLHEFLEEKRYLVVLDDIWSMEVWDGLKPAFSSGKVGSKVKITTRSWDVALQTGSTPHEPRILTLEESLELFQKRAFPRTKSIPVELEKLSREMVVKCRGLPLAVVVLGGFLSRKRNSTEEWQKVLDNISWHLIKSEDRIATVLALSYNDLPLHLKSCFLYLGLFPEDVSIRTKKLIHLWVAEGFLPQEGEETAEGVAEKCINELIHRCMIQAGRVSTLGRVKTFRIHDLLRDLSISRGKEENFLQIYHRNKKEPSAHLHKSRRQAVHSSYDRYTFLKTSAPHSHSLLFFNRDHSTQAVRKQITITFLGQEYNVNLRVDKKLNFIYQHFKQLRVLDLDGVRLVSLPSTIGNLLQLRYLGLRKTNLEEELPLSLGNLLNLQTLDLRYCCFLKRIPNVIWKMVNLRHLLLYTPFDCPDTAHLRMDTLTNLQSLPIIEAGSWIEDGGLANMINFRKLGIDGLSREKVNSVVSITERLPHLQTLSLILESGEETFPNLMLFSQCRRLLKLCLYGKMEKLPDPHEFPPNLIKLNLSNSDLEQDAISKLERLPNLKMLVLGNGTYNWKEMTFSSQGFPSLQTLRLHLLKELEEWIVEEGAMPWLSHLVINRCDKLKGIPDGLKLITTLKELDIVGMPMEFEFRLQTKDLIEFRQIPSVKSNTDALAMAIEALAVGSY